MFGRSNRTWVNVVAVLGVAGLAAPGRAGFSAPDQGVTDDVYEPVAQVENSLATTFNERSASHSLSLGRAEAGYLSADAGVDEFEPSLTPSRTRQLGATGVRSTGVTNLADDLTEQGDFLGGPGRHNATPSELGPAKRPGHVTSVTQPPVGPSVVPGPTAALLIPLPTAATSGLTGLLVLGLIGAFKKGRRLLL